MAITDYPGPITGIPDPTEYGDISSLPKGQVLPFVVQEHLARKAGKHYDVRLGSDNMFSWATKKGLPQPGELQALYQTPLHEESYMHFEGSLPKGMYGAGKVRPVDKGSVVVHKAEPNKVIFTTAHARNPQTYVMIRTGTKPTDWLVRNLNPKSLEDFAGPGVSFEKEHYKSVPTSEIEKHYDPKKTFSEKIDGARMLLKLKRHHVEAASYRPSVTGAAIMHTSRLQLPRDLNIPANLVGSTLVGETYGERVGEKTAAGERLGWLERLPKIQVDAIKAGLRAALDPASRMSPQVRSNILDRYPQFKAKIQPAAPMVQPAPPVKVGEYRDSRSLKKLIEHLRGAAPAEPIDNKAAPQSDSAMLTGSDAPRVGQGIKMGAVNLDNVLQRLQEKMNREKQPAVMAGSACEKYADAESLGKSVVSSLPSGINIASVRGEFVRNNYDLDFARSGHHYRYPFIPENEVWVEKMQSKLDKKMAVQHALIERSCVTDLGMTLEQADQKATNAERFLRKHHGGLTKGHNKYATINGEWTEPPVAKHPIDVKDTQPKRPKPVQPDTRKMLQDKVAGLLGAAKKAHDGSFGASPESNVTHMDITFGLDTKRLKPDEIRKAISEGKMKGICSMKHVVKKADAIPPQELGGILNASLAESLRKQKEQKVQLRTAVFNILSHGKKPVGSEVPYPERIKMIQEIMGHLPKEQFHMPEMATTPESQKALFEAIQAGKNRRTTEGVVAWPETGVPTKFKFMPESDVVIRGTFPGAGKYEGTGVGGFEYSLPGKTDVLGRVGTGLSDELRREMFKSPEAYVGRTARIHSMGQFPSGAHRAPGLIAMHEDIPQDKAAAVDLNKAVDQALALSRNKKMNLNFALMQTLGDRKLVGQAARVARERRMPTTGLLDTLKKAIPAEPVAKQMSLPGFE
jgi:hypothetical protein